jgi:hypothetical protein
MHLFSANTDLGLPLGIALGVGLPALLGIAVGSAYYFKQSKRKNTYLRKGSDVDDQTIYPGYQYVDNDNDISTTVF